MVISTIIQFYLVFYLLCKIYERVNRKMFFCITMTSSIIWWMLVILTNHSSERVWNAFFLQYLWEFALGMIIAEMIFRGGRISCRIWKIILLSVLGIGLEAVMGMGNSVTKSLNDIACLVGFGGLTIVIYTLKITFVHRIIEYMSKISYELYLTHWLVFSVFYHYISPNGWEREVVSGIIAFGLSILVAKLFQIVLHKVLGLNYKLKSI